MSRLTTFSRFLLTLAIVAAIFFGGKYLLENTSTGKSLSKKSQEAATGSAPAGSVSDATRANSGSAADNDPNTIKVGVVTWGGYAGGQYFNEGFAASDASRFTKEYGINVSFKVLDDFDASRAAWKKDEVNLLWTTADAFPTEAGALKDFDPQIIFQADWSRGGDAIVVRRGINNVADLKGKKIAVAELTPSHSFLIWLLDAGGMTANDVTIVKQSNAIDAAQAFKSQQVDAAVVWSPDDDACISAVPGARILQSTRSASNIIADVFIAKRKYIEANKDKLQKLYEGWMRGAAEINNSDAAKQKAARILTSAFAGTTQEMNVRSINNVRLATHGDNLNFFGLNPDYKGVNGEALYNRMAIAYKNLGYIKDNPPSWRLIANPDMIRMTSDLTGPTNAAEGQKTFAVATEAQKTKEAVATKRVSINFRSGEYALDENAKYIVDREFVPIAKAFSNSRIRVEGNTDNIGGAGGNKALSLKRAQSVADYLVTAYSMPRNRFIVVGNGPDNPVADNGTEDGKAKNRRTDFEIVPE